MPSTPLTLGQPLVARKPPRQKQRVNLDLSRSSFAGLGIRCASEFSIKHAGGATMSDINRLGVAGYFRYAIFALSTDARSGMPLSPMMP
jgi:hypothetical protein